VIENIMGASPSNHSSNIVYSHYVPNSNTKGQSHILRSKRSPNILVTAGTCLIMSSYPSAMLTLLSLFVIYISVGFVGHPTTLVEGFLQGVRINGAGPCFGKALSTNMHENNKWQPKLTTHTTLNSLIYHRHETPPTRWVIWRLCVAELLLGS
jgi:hypothetical protein